MDAHTVVIVLPAPYGPGISLLDAVPILPRHKLKAALDAGTFRDAWGLSTPLTDIVGLGPFVLKEYVSGQRLVLTRNPRFWLKDAAAGSCRTSIASSFSSARIRTPKCFACRPAIWT